MADFMAVIRRAVDGLSNNTPEMRAKVYDKARAAVVRQLENMSPRPPEHMLQRQLEKLDAAIREVEAEHAEALPDGNEAEPVVASPEIAQDFVEPARPVDDAVEQAPPVESAQVAPHADNGAVQDSWNERQAEAETKPVEPVHYSDDGDWAAEHMATPASPPVDAPVESAWPSSDVAEPTPQPVVAAPETVAADERSQPLDMWGDDDRAVEPDLAYPQSQAEPADFPAQPAVVPPDARADLPPAETSDWHAPDESNLAPIWGQEEEVYPRQSEAQVAPSADHSSIEPSLDLEPQSGRDRSFAAASAMPAVSDIDDWLANHVPATVSPSTSSAVADPWDMPVDSLSVSEPVPHFQEPTVTPTSESFASVDPVTAYDVNVSSPPAAEPEPFAPWDVPPPLDANGNKAADDFSQWFQDPVDLNAKASDLSIKGEAKAEEWLDPTAELLAHPAAVNSAAAADPMASVLQPSPQPSYRLEPRRSRSYAPIIAAAVGILVLAGGGFAGWTYRDQVASLFGGASAPEVTTAEDQPPATQAPAAEQPVAAAVPEADSGPQKFTQRLRADGTEVDPGAAPAPEGTVENRTVSGQTVASATEPTDAIASEPALSAPSATIPTTPGAAPIAGDKVFLYEERIGQSSPTAIPGGVVWTALREVGADGKPDPQIQGRINIPERGISALLTIKRNTDSSLPASHIIEVVFSVPPGFEGGAIDNLQRIAMKTTEQDRGDPLVAVAAKVTDDTYLIALNDFEEVVQRNLDLMRNRGWIDIPVTYRNGRRALLTLDKGTDGTRIFNEVIQEWNAL
ncbi:hypothetical protein FE840_017090 [Peteryoungia desertarenae]|uniref:Uncharacterized protein n=1 Tax=Peteryoungia desertarenae TaxID=1813451 RepID=A0ABX6QRJ0_9HYPH|nr:hypothetical protein [Peteryoungia desertarenae]QLF71129.1 hypothetical protein FE840_017090 [Peteryoungia desertarenae]